MKLGMLVGLSGIYIVLAWAFASYSRPFAVMAVIPMGFIGAVIGHWLLGYNLTILSLIGLVGLSGIVINGSIILATTVDQRMKSETLFDAISNIVSSTLMILLFAIFIFLEEVHLNYKLKQIFSNSPIKFKRLNDTLNKIEWSVARYLGIKTIISLLTGFLSYLVLISAEINFAIFWAFLIFGTYLSIFLSLGCFIFTVVLPEVVVVPSET